MIYSLLVDLITSNSDLVMHSLRMVWLAILSKPSHSMLVLLLPLLLLETELVVVPIDVVFKQLSPPSSNNWLLSSSSPFLYTPFQY